MEEIQRRAILNVSQAECSERPDCEGVPLALYNVHLDSENVSHTSCYERPDSDDVQQASCNRRPDSKDVSLNSCAVLIP